MLKKLLTIALFLPLCTYARKIPPIEIRDIANSEPKFTHYVGVQSNLLIRQIFNLSGTTADINNPYLLTYSLVNKKGWAIAFGQGIQFGTSNVTDANSNSTKTNNQKINTRLGIEKRTNLNSRWIATIGVEGLMNWSKNNSETVENNFGSFLSTINTSEKLQQYGGGLRGSLSYAINKRILIGTESSLSFISSNSSFTQSVSNSNFNSSTTSSTLKSNGIDFKVPTAIFLIVKF
jgi:hypothetical protein